MNMARWFTGNASQSKQEPPKQEDAPKAHIIILGNEKGGSGKTTTCMHLITALMRMGFSVGSMDIDARQRSLSRYIENRRKTIAKEGVQLPTPHHIVITKSPFNVRDEAEEDEAERFKQGLSRISQCDFVLIDSPGNDTFLSRLAHSYADTVITPINDSFVDLDVLASVDGETLKIIRPSIYSEMVWEQKVSRAKRDKGSMQWIVMRNRLSNLDARNKRSITKVLTELSRRIGFRTAPGFSERVIYREMFLQGLTVLDVIDMSGKRSVTMSHIAARQEVRELLKMLRIPEVDRRINELRKQEEEQRNVKVEPKKTKPAEEAKEEAADDSSNEVRKTAAAEESADTETTSSDAETVKEREPEAASA